MAARTIFKSVLVISSRLFEPRGRQPEKLPLSSPVGCSHAPSRFVFTCLVFRAGGVPSWLKLDLMRAVGGSHTEFLFIYFYSITSGRTDKTSMMGETTLENDPFVGTRTHAERAELICKQDHFLSSACVRTQDLKVHCNDEREILLKATHTVRLNENSQ